MKTTSRGEDTKVRRQASGRAADQSGRGGALPVGEPPHDIAAEQCVLGGMLTSRDAISDVLEVIRPADHYRPAHQLVHEVILDLYSRGEPADVITVANELTKRGEVKQLGEQGPSYLHTLIASVPVAANARYYARIVRERAILRRLVEVGTRIVQFGYSTDGDADEKVARARSELAAVSDAEQAGEEQGTLNPIPDYPVDALTGPLHDLARNTILPAGLVGGAGLGALAGLCGQARLVMPGGAVQRSIVWPVNLAVASGGKTPAQNRAFGYLRKLDALRYDQHRVELDEWQKQPKQSREPRPKDPRRRFDDFTFEVLARRLDRSDGSGVVDADELSGFLTSIGQYKGKGSNSDLSRLLTLWTGFSWSYERVGESRDGGIGIEINIAEPVVSVCGGLQPHLHPLLGDAQSGLRPRWLPHYVPAQTPEWDDTPVPGTWEKAIEELYGLREGREWELAGSARNDWAKAGSRWKQQQRDGAESISVIAALGKADIQCARIALVIAESLDPGKGGELPREAMRSAIAIMDYVLGCWRALPEGQPFALSRRDEILHRGVDEVVAWLDQHGGQATRRQLQRAHVAGIRTAPELDALLRQYRDTYPGCVRKEQVGTRGPRSEVVYAPARAAHAASPDLFRTHNRETVDGDSFSAVCDSDIVQETAGHENATSSDGTVASGDSFPGDSSLATVTATQSDEPPRGGGWPDGSIGQAVNAS